jgi:hypothetical protein
MAWSFGKTFPACRGQILISRSFFVPKTTKKVRTFLSRRRLPASRGCYRPYLGTVAGACLGGCWIEPFPITIASPSNGGLTFAGKSGRNTANACDANAIETIMIAAAYFISGALIKIQHNDK